MNPDFRHHSRWLVSTALVAVNVAFANLGLTTPAWANCGPLAAATGVSATCTGLTNNQGAGAPGTSLDNDGYGTGLENTMTVNVVSGATVTGSSSGINARDDLTVTNLSNINAGVLHGIQVRDRLTVTNSVTGTIRGGADGVGIAARDNAIVVNSGTIIGGTAILTRDFANVTNSGTITGQGGNAIGFIGAGGNNTLTLLPSSIINGIVQASTGGNDALQFSGTGAATFDVSLIGAAAQYRNFDLFNKIGSSTWTLTGNNPDVMPWFVNAGTLNVTGLMSGSNMTVNTGGTLTGAGTVHDITVNNGGRFAPGNGTPGTSMIATGSLAFQSGAQYIIALNPATSSLTSVQGTAALGGATVVANFAPGAYVAKQYTILTANGGLGATTFNSAVANVPSYLKAVLSYDANNAYLNLTVNLTPNQPPPGTSPIGTAPQQTTFNAMSQFMGMLTDCPDDRYRAISSMERNGGCDRREAAGSPANSYAMYTKVPPRVVAPRYSGWSVWAGAFGGSQTTDGNATLGSATTTSRIAAGAAGANYWFSPNTIAGFALAGGGTDFSIANNLGTGHSDLFQAGAFVRHTVGAAYFTGALAYGWQDVTTNRTVTIAGIDQLQARYNTNAYSGRAEGGYRFGGPVMGITPYAAAQFTTVDLPAYAERAVIGFNTFALAYNAKSVTDPRTELGVRTDKSWMLPNAILTLRGRLAWAHDYNPDRNITATFQTLPGPSFVVNGASQAPNSALTTAAAEVKWANGWSTAATFEGEFSNVTRSYAGKGLLRYAW